VLNHVEAGRLLEQPAREDLAPGQRLICLGALFDKDLHEGPGLLRLLPRQRAFARIELDHDIADPARLARLHHQVLAEIVALVEQAERGDAVLDRGAVFALDHRRGALLCGDLLGDRSRRSLRVVVAPFATGQQPRKRQHGQAKQSDRARHGQASGVQAW
jgi:hypothetical protein